MNNIINPLIDKHFIAFIYKKSISYGEKKICSINKSIVEKGEYKPYKGLITVLDLIEYDNRLNYETVMFYLKNYEKCQIKKAPNEQ